MFTFEAFYISCQEPPMSSGAMDTADKTFCCKKKSGNGSYVNTATRLLSASQLLSSLCYSTPAPI